MYFLTTYCLNLNCNHYWRKKEREWQWMRSEPTDVADWSREEISSKVVKRC